VALILVALILVALILVVFILVVFILVVFILVVFILVVLRAPERWFFGRRVWGFVRAQGGGESVRGDSEGAACCQLLVAAGVREAGVKEGLGRSDDSIAAEGITDGVRNCE
jgi:hypothetical protein